MNFYQKGSEEIFESAPPASTPVATSNKDLRIDESTTSVDRENILTKTISPEQAYEVFQGKFFGVLKMKEKEKIMSESAADRLSRIQIELRELSVEMEKAAANQKKGTSAEGNLQLTIKSNAEKLSQNALQLESHPLLNNSNYPSRSPALDARIKELGAAIAAGQSVNSKMLVSTGLATDEESNIAKRISLLESVLGSASNVLDVETVYGLTPKNKVFPLADALLSMELRLGMLDDHGLDVLRARSKALRIELEAVNRVASGPQSQVDQKLAAETAWKKVADLGDKLKHLESVVDDLPSLVVRLKTLESIHQAAGSFNQRVLEMETASNNISGQLQSNRELLEAVKKGMKENVAQMLQNIGDVDTRIAAIKKR